MYITNYMESLFSSPKKRWMRLNTYNMYMYGSIVWRLQLSHVNRNRSVIIKNRLYTAIVLCRNAQDPWKVLYKRYRSDALQINRVLYLTVFTHRWKILDYSYYNIKFEIICMCVCVCKKKVGIYIWTHLKFFHIKVKNIATKYCLYQRQNICTKRSDPNFVSL